MVKRLIFGGSALVLAIAGLALPAHAQSGASQLTPPSAPPIRATPGQSPAQTPTQAPGRSTAPAQEAAPTAVSSADLQKFARALQEVRGLQSQAQNDMLQALQSEGLTPERFNQIAEATQRRTPSNSTRSNAVGTPDGIPSQPSRTNVSAEDRQRFERVVQQLTQIQQAARGKQEQAVTASGLSVQQFNQIFAAVRQNPQLQEQVRNLIEPSAPAQSPSQQTPAQRTPRQGSEQRTP